MKDKKEKIKEVDIQDIVSDLTAVFVKYDLAIQDIVYTLEAFKFALLSKQIQ